MAKLKIALLLLLLTAMAAPAHDGSADWPLRPRFILDAPYGGPSATSIHEKSTLFRRCGDLLTPRLTPDRRVVPWESLDSQTHLRIRKEASQLFGRATGKVTIG